MRWRSGTSAVVACLAGCTGGQDPAESSATLVAAASTPAATHRPVAADAPLEAPVAPERTPLPFQECRLLVHVLDESGQRLPAVAPLAVHFVRKDELGLHWRRALADERDPEAFVVLFERADVEGALLATGSDLRVGYLEPVRADEGELELRLRAPVSFTVEVREEPGDHETPLVAFHPRILGVPLADRYLNAGETWLLRRLPYRVQVEAGLRYRTLVRDIAADDIPSCSSLELTPWPTIEGVVTSGGAPAASVYVELFAAAPAPAPYADFEGRARTRRTPRATCTSDREGRFSLPATGSGSFSLRASSWPDGGCEQPLTLREGEGRADLRLELEPVVGSVSGQVLLPSGIGRTRVEFWGPSYFAMDVASDGHFELDSVLAGDWRLVLYDQESEHGQVGFDGLLVWPLRVETGKRSTIAFDLRTPPRCRLRGTLTADDAPLMPRPRRHYLSPSTGSARLERFGTCVDDQGLSGAAVEPDGTFRLAALEPADAQLSVDIETEDGIDWEIFDRLTLVAGEQSWSLDVPTGSVRVRGGTPQELLLFDELRLRWQGPGERVVLARSPRCEDDGSRLFERVPAGTGELIAGDDARVLARVFVAAGATSEIDLR